MAHNVNKSLFSKDYAGLYPMAHLVLKCLQIISSNEKIRICVAVCINLIAVIINVGAIAVLYRSLKIYFTNETNINWLAWTLDMNATTKLTLLLMPAFILMLISSLILRLGRVQISRSVLNLKSAFSDYLTTTISLDPDHKDEDIEPMLNGIFGAIRAFFLNLFAIIQAIICAIGLLFLDWPTAIFLVLFFSSYMIFLLLHNEKKKGAEKDEEPAPVTDMVEDEFMGLTSKSFERLEKMRFFGRNMNSALLVLFVLFAIIFQRDYTETLYDFTLMFLLMRYIGQILVPLSVLSGAFFPFQKTAYCLINVINMQQLTRARKYDKNIVALFISRNAKRRDNLTKVETQKNLAQELGVQHVFVGTARLPDNRVLSSKELATYISQKAIFNAEGTALDAKIIFSI